MGQCPVGVRSWPPHMLFRSAVLMAPILPFIPKMAVTNDMFIYPLLVLRQCQWHATSASSLRAAVRKTRLGIDLLMPRTARCPANRRRIRNYATAQPPTWSHKDIRPLLFAFW